MSLRIDLYYILVYDQNYGKSKLITNKGITIYIRKHYTIMPSEREIDLII